MKHVVVSLIVCLLLFSPALAAEIHYVDQLVVSQTISGGVDITLKSPKPVVQSIELDLYLFGQDDTQQRILYESTEPLANKDEEQILFYWEQPPPQSVRAKITQEIRMRPEQVVVKEKVPFPLEQLPPDVASYVAFTDHIDRSPRIAALAQSLATDEDDLFKLQHKIANWVTSNIAYNLSTITREANIPSSIVIDQGYGVCDEITNLFLSINRELGIPARFVSGIAYSESILFSQPWGNHGWAEVYFPGVGWIPYDVTYEQFGWIDPTHIALNKEVDGATPAIKTKTVGYGYEFALQPLQFKTEILNIGNPLPARTHIELELYEPQVGFGSYNVVQATVTNNQDHYVSETLTLATTKEMTLLDEQKKRVALAPGEKKRVTWVVQIEEDLNPTYKYTFPVTVYDSVGLAYGEQFIVQEELVFLPYELLPLAQDFTIKDQPILCLGPGEVYQSTSAGITCYLAKGETRSRTICLEGKCEQVSEETNATFLVDTETLGVFTKKLTFGRDEVIVSYRVTDYPATIIENLRIKGEAAYDVPITISFDVVRSSFTIPRNVTIRISSALVNQQWQADAIQHAQPVSLAIPSQILAWGNNSMNIIVSDNFGVLAQETISIYITPEDADDYLYATVNKLNMFLANKGLHSKSTRNIVSTLIIASIVVIILKTLFWSIRKATKKKK